MKSSSKSLLSDESYAHGKKKGGIIDLSDSTSQEHIYKGMRSFAHGKAKLDEYYTHVEAVEFLMSFLRLNNAMNVWEPCCGKINNIARVLKTRGINCYSSDIQNFKNVEGIEFFDKQIDFLSDDCEIPPNVNIIITNPPWSQNKKFLLKLFKMNKPFCVLIRLDVINSVYFKEAIKELPVNYPLYALLLHNKLSKFMMKDSNKNIVIGKCIWLVGGYTPVSSDNVLRDMFQDMNFKASSSSSSGILCNRYIPVVIHHMGENNVFEDDDEMSNVTQETIDEIDEADEDFDEDMTMNSDLIIGFQNGCEVSK